MENLITAFAASSFGLAGAFAGYRLKVPGGVLTGAMVGTGGALALLGFPEVRLPAFAGGALQVLVGILVGFKISRDSLRSGARPLLSAGVLAVIFVLSGLVAALAAVSLTGIDAVTALFAAAPGGMTEMSFVGASLGADGLTVATVHLSRLLLVIFLVNVLVARMRATVPPEDEPVSEAPPRRDDEDLARLAAIAAAGVAGGVICLLATPLPAGGVIGAMAGSGLVRLMLTGPVPERLFQLSVQGLGGGVIGLGISAQFFQTLAQLAGVVAVVNVIQMLVWLAAGYLLVRAFSFDLTTSTLASAPGGMGTLISISSEADADPVTVAFIHFLRLSTTIVVVPFLPGVLPTP